MRTIAATGQVLIHQPLDFNANGAAAVKSFLSGADFAIANLEATVRAQGAWPTKTKTLHLAQAAALLSVRELGFDALAHANNHAFDLGPPGIVETQIAASAAGLQLSGSGINLAEAMQPAIVHKRSSTYALISIDLGPQPQINYAGPNRAGLAPLRMERSITCPPERFQYLQQMIDALGESARQKARQQVGYDERMQNAKELEFFGTRLIEGAALGFDWQVRQEDWQAFERALIEAKKAAECVVIAVHSHHWDPDWSHAPQWWHKLACRMIDKGADVIVGTGAPVLQPISFYKHRPIFSGLGNCVFHTHRAAVYDQERPAVWKGAACRAHFDSMGNCSRVEILPLTVGRPELHSNGLPLAPQALEGKAAADIFDQMSGGLTPVERALVHLAR